MSEVLLLQQRCRNSILLGESHFREFKTALEGKPGQKKPRRATDICREIGEALVAFANADGGELFIGVEDDGEITGLRHDDDDIRRMLEAPNTHLYTGQALPMSLAAKVTIDDKNILIFSVSKGTTEYYQLPDGRCVRRKDKSTMPAAINQLQFERQEVRSREYDRQFVDGAAVVDLDVSLLRAIANEYAGGLTPERYLQQLGLAEYALNGLRLRMAAILLFAKDVLRWHPRSQVRILKVAGTQLGSGTGYNVISDDTVQGNIFELIPRSWERLRSFIAEKTVFGPDARFEQRYLYPEQACREALVNAIAHRDYNIQNGIDVFIFEDRMEIKSPGALLSTLSIDSLKQLQGEHESRNALVARVLRENEVMRELGEGMKRMFEAMDMSELAEPVPYSNGNSFTMTFTHQSIFTREQLQWLEHFKDAELSRLQKRIVVLGMNGREISPAEIHKAMRTDDRDTYDREVTSLRNAGILVESRTKVQAANVAKQRQIPKNSVGRFKVITHPVLRKNQDLRPDIKTDPNTTVYVNELSLETTRETLEELVENALAGSSPLRRIVMKKGFAFIELENEHAVSVVVKKLNNTIVDGRTIHVKKDQRSRS